MNAFGLTLLVLRLVSWFFFLGGEGGPFGAKLIADTFLLFLNIPMDV